MAIVKYGTNIAGIRRTIGGVTFGKSGSTPSCRVWRPSTMRFSPAQTQAQSRIPNLVAPWNSLTAQQRIDWNSLGASPPETDVNSLGQTYLLSGWQWFVRCNSRLLASGLPVQMTAPAGIVTNPATLSLFGTYYGSSFYAWIYYVSSQWTAGYKQIIYATGNRLHGNTKPRSNFFLMGTFTWTVANTTLITTPYTAQFGIPPIGDSMFCKVYQQAPTGIRSAIRTAQCIVVQG